MYGVFYTLYYGQRILSNWTLSKYLTIFLSILYISIYLFISLFYLSILFCKSVTKEICRFEIHRVSLIFRPKVGGVSLMHPHHLFAQGHESVPETYILILKHSFFVLFKHYCCSYLLLFVRFIYVFLQLNPKY